MVETIVRSPAKPGWVSAARDSTAVSEAIQAGTAVEMVAWADSKAGLGVVSVASEVIPAGTEAVSAGWVAATVGMEAVRVASGVATAVSEVELADPAPAIPGQMPDLWVVPVWWGSPV